jgi:hypothetical protein
MNQSHIETLTVAIEEYSSKYRGFGLPDLEMSDLYDLFPAGDHSNSNKAWPAKWPMAEKPGVYFFFDDDLQLLYVGKASMNNTLGARLSSYCGYAADRSCQLKHSWSRKPRFVTVIGLNDDLRFEAPALEEFLIMRLKPVENTVGLGKPQS